MANVSDVSILARPRGRVGTAVGWFFLVLLGAWLAADVLRTVVFALRSFGPAALFTDGVLHFRLGAALLILPLAWGLLAGGWKDLSEQMPRRKLSAVLSWVGAALCLLTAITLRGRLAWWVLAPAMALIGAPWAAGKMGQGRLRRAVRWVQLVALLLLYLLAAAGAYLISGYAVVPYPAPYPPLIATPDRDERWRQDARYLASELPRLHLNAYHAVPQAEFQARVSQLEKDIPRLSDDEISLEMMGIVASVGDAHTRLRTGRNGPAFYPVELAWYSDGLYVVKATSSNKEALGAHVTGIGRLTAEEAYLAVLPYISYENEAWARQQSAELLRIASILQRIGAADEPQGSESPAQNVSYHLVRPDGSSFLLKMSPLTSEEGQVYESAVQTPPYFLSRSEPFWMEYREKTRTLYFRYAACVDPTGFSKLSGELWKTVDQKPVDRLIIDLRANGGGNTLQFDQFFLPGLLQRLALNQPDRLFVLIDSGTFSAAVDNAVTLKQKTHATFVGQPTGGRPNSYGEVRYFVLPHSHFSVFYSTKIFQRMPGDPPTLRPNRLIPLPARDAFNGSDPVLEKIAPGEKW